jgi:hypothetical protein
MATAEHLPQVTRAWLSDLMEHRIKELTYSRVRDCDDSATDEGKLLPDTDHTLDLVDDLVQAPDGVR